jgi:hypothetical protein
VLALNRDRKGADLPVTALAKELVTEEDEATAELKVILMPGISQKFMTLCDRGPTA